VNYFQTKQWTNSNYFKKLWWIKIFISNYFKKQNSET